MSKPTHRKSAILGPDGKPLVVPVAPPAPKPESRDLSGLVSRYVFSMGHDRSIDDQPVRQAKPVTLRDAVARDVASLTAGFDGQGGAELPQPPADLTRYQDAFQSARKNCPHQRVRETLYAAREGYCEDCRRVVHYRPGSGLFGGGGWE